MIRPRPALLALLLAATLAAEAQTQQQSAFALLWAGRYEDARRAFAAILRQEPRDAAARLGFAQSLYWAGDYRGALRAFERVLEVQPSNADARRSIDEIRSASRPGYAVTAAALDDDQPYRGGSTDARLFFFSDPLTKWELRGGGSHLDAGGEERSTSTLGIAGETTLPSIRTRVRAGVQRFAFPDDEAALLPSIAIERRLRTSAVALNAERLPLLRTASALRTHPYGDVVALRWESRGAERMQWAAGAEHIRYFDRNRGWGADAYALFPLHGVLAGASIAWRDTRESRFRSDSGTYDPYYTPRQLAEARAVVAWAYARGRLSASAHLDGGIGRERGISYTPWKAAVGAAVRLTPALTLSASASHESTVFYRVDEISAGLAGRF